MRLDEGLEDQKLALDITPLIDIIFLLVLFFAVSTSFISGEDLRTLQTDVVVFDQERKELSSTLETQTAELGELNKAYDGLQTDFTRMVAEKTAELQTLARRVEETDGKAAKLEFMVAALENQKVDLEGRLTDRADKNKSLESQLEKAYQDFQHLNAELTASKTQAEERAEQERLLRALLLERDEKQRSLESERDALNASSLALRAEIEARATEVRKVQTKAEAAAAQELLLQKLLAEKAAELDGMRVRIESADASAQRLEATLQDTKEQAQASAAAQALAAQTEAREMQTQVLRLQSELNKYREVANLDREQIERILQAQAQLEAGLGQYLEDKQLGLKRDQQRLTLQLSDKILFDSGKATIKREGLEVLRNLGAILKQRMSQLEIQIGGHTDNVPIRGRTGPLADNWGLSAARAVTVVRFFEQEVGIDPLQMSAVGYSEHRPVSANDSAKSRSKNRRIEIVLLPR